MDVANINGTGGVDHGAHRPHRVDRGRDSSQRKEPTDSATISSDGRRTLQSAEDFAAVLRAGEVERQDRIDDARARLESGELDSPEVLRDTARDVLRSL